MTSCIACLHDERQTAGTSNAYRCQTRQPLEMLSEWGTDHGISPFQIQTLPPSPSLPKTTSSIHQYPKMQHELFSHSIQQRSEAPPFLMYTATFRQSRNQHMISSIIKTRFSWPIAILTLAESLQIDAMQ